MLRKKIVTFGGDEMLGLGKGIEIILTRAGSSAAPGLKPKF